MPAQSYTCMYSIQSTLILTKGRRNERVSAGRCFQEEGKKTKNYNLCTASILFRLLLCIHRRPHSLRCFICATCSMQLCRLTFMCEIEFYLYVIKLTISSSFG